MHFRLIHVDLLLVLNKLLEQTLQRLVWRGVLVIDLWGTAYIWHAIYISFLKGIVLARYVLLARDVLLALAELLRAFPANLIAFRLSDTNYDIFGPLTTKSFAGIKIAVEWLYVTGHFLLLQVHGQLLLFDEIIGHLDGKRIDIHLQLVVVDDLVVDERIEPAPVLEIALEFSDLGDECLFHEGAENSN